MHPPSVLTDPPPSLHSGDVTAVRDLLLRNLGRWQTMSDCDPLTGRATRLLGAAAAVRLALQLRSIATLANRRAFLLPYWTTGWFREQPVPTMPESLVYPLNAYLADLPGYDTALPYKGQRGDEARRQHARVLFVALPSWSGGGLPS